MAADIPGFHWGIVVDNQDPLGAGRVRFKIKNLFEPYHHQWAEPIGWPGGGMPGAGSRYNMKLGALVAVFFEQGVADAPPAFLPGPYGSQLDSLLFPSETKKDYKNFTGPAKERGTAALDKTVIWEDQTFSFWVSEKEKVMYIRERQNDGIVLELNAADGESGKAASVTIFARTNLNLEADGLISIKAKTVQIQDRTVARKGKPSTI